MSATGYSSWPTPTAEDSESTGDRPSVETIGATTLTAAARSLWPTPDAGISNDGETPESFLARQESLKAKGYNSNGAGTPLAMAAVNWPTPTAMDAASSGHRADERTPTSHEGTTLTDAIHKLWATPTTQDSENDAAPSQLRRKSDALNVQASLWASPMASEARQGYQRRPAGMASEQNQESLSTQAATWPTPTTSDGGVESSRVHGDKLATRLGQFAPSRPDPAPEPNGQPSSPPGRTSRPRLNPRFVEWLMGWPEGWSTASIDSGCSATGSCRWLRQQRSWLSRLGLA